MSSVGAGTAWVVKRYEPPRSGRFRYLAWPASLATLCMFMFVGHLADRDPTHLRKGAVALVPVPVLVVALVAVLAISVTHLPRRRTRLVQRVEVWSDGRVELRCLGGRRTVRPEEVVAVERDVPTAGDAQITLADDWTGILPGATTTRDHRKALARLHHVIRVAAGDAPPRPSDDP